MRLRSIPPRYIIKGEDATFAQEIHRSVMQAKQAQLAEIETFMAEGLGIGLAAFAQKLRRELAREKRQDSIS